MSSIRDKLAQKKSKLAFIQERLEDHPAKLNDYQDGSFYTLEIELIQPDPSQPRKYFDPKALAELAESIKQKGVLQPVIIRKNHDGTIYLVAGERRYRAAKMAGLTKIPAILTTGNPMEIALIENLQRENLKPLEEAEALQCMIEKHNYTQERLALVIGKAKSTISEILSFNRLPEQIKNEIRQSNYYPKRMLIEIAKQETPKEMMALFTKVKNENLTSDQVKVLIHQQSSRKQRTPANIVIERALTLNKSIQKINLLSIEEKEKIRLLNTLEKLYQSLETLLH